MNERIRELVLQATDIVETFNPDTGITHHREFFNQEKFALLIVRECAEIADCHWRNRCPGLYVKEHFGVE
jgi:hypothetical protein